MDSTALTATQGTDLLSRALVTWRSRRGLGTVIAPRTGAFTGGAMAAYPMAPATTDRMVTDHDPISLRPAFCRPPV